MSGVLKERIDLSAVEQEVLVQFPELAWARAYFTRNSLCAGGGSETATILTWG